jgi:arginyl-tRNA synthetase
MQTFEDAIRRALARTAGLAAEDVKLEAPRDEKLGDIAFPCFVVAKAAKRPPPVVAAGLAQSLASELPGIAVSATAPT